MHPWKLYLKLSYIQWAEDNTNSFKITGYYRSEVLPPHNKKPRAPKQSHTFFERTDSIVGLWKNIHNYPDKNYDWIPENIIDLLEFVKEHRFLYDKSDINYKDTKSKLKNFK